MNQQQYATTVAEAYMRQYGPDASPVMGQPVIIYRTDTKLFDWQSSVHDLENGEIFVSTVEEEQFGDMAANDAADIIALIMDDTRTWHDICDSLEQMTA